MDYGNMLGESFNYAREGVVEKMNRWVMLAIATIILCIPLTGYMIRIYKGAKPAPEVDDWGKLFIDGIMLMVISFIYAIPLFIIQFFMLGAFTASALTGISGHPTAMMAGLAGGGILFLVYIIVAIIIGLIVPFALIRFARSGNFGEAFNFNAILAHIGKVDWINYIIAMIIVAIVIGIPLAIIWFILLMLIVGLPVIGMLLAVLAFLIIIPPVAVFQARYLTQIYDTAAA